MSVTAGEKVAVKAGSSRFEVTQEFHESEEVQAEFTETVRFLKPAFPSVRLSGTSWPGFYDISPDEKWLLRRQKTGSGASSAMLYRIEDNGRVSEVLGFNDSLWKASDAVSKFRQEELYHVRIGEATWSEDSRSIAIFLFGTNQPTVEGELEVRVVYDLKSHKVSVKNRAGGQGPDGKAQ